MNNINIGFIGAGKVAITLGCYFKSCGACVNGYFSKTKNSAKNASLLTNSNHYFTLERLISDCNFIFITTPDDEILNVWNEILKYNLDQKIIIHTSGAHSSKIFCGIESTKACGFSLHPMYAFSKKDGSFENLDNAFFTLEGSEEKLLQIKEFIENLGNTVFLISDEQKPLYHLANVMASNFVLALISQSVEILSEIGISNDDAVCALMPLIFANISNIKNCGTTSALTGPVERNDICTIKKHLEVASNSQKKLYKDLSKILLDIAKNKNPTRDYTELFKTLNSDI